MQPDSPAAKGGIHRGDVITAIDGTAVTDGNVLRNHVAQMQPGTKAEISLLRNGKEETATVTLAELKAADGDKETPDAASDGSGYGMSVEPLTRDTARQLGVEATAGVVVREVQQSGRAAEAGLRSGDVSNRSMARPSRAARRCSRHSKTATVRHSCSSIAGRRACS